MEHLCISISYSCKVTITLSRTKYPNAGLGVSAARTANNGDVISPYYGTIVYYELPRHQRTREMFENGALKADVTRSSECAL